MNGHTPTTHNVASTREVTLAVHHFGGTGPTLLINHATGFHARCYLPMMSTLTQYFDVWGADFGGHGDSTMPANGDFAWDGFADDILTVVDHIGASSVRAFGHSMGATATLLAAKKRPNVIEAAWLYEPIVFPPEIVPRNAIMAEAASKRRREFASKPEALHRYASRPPLSMMRSDALAAYVDHGFHDTEAGTVTLACSPESEAATFNNAGISVEDIRGLDLRVTIAHGQSTTEPSPAGFAGPTARALPNGSLVVYDGLGHFGPLQDPDLIAHDMVTFLT
ncbi:MAG: alpha/beta hydrolase [Acidimicrobiales bacterium]|jgi:pimeloyl-ACP methyl ester carboxylesterase